MNIVPREQWFNMDHFFDDLFTHRQLQLKGKEGFFEPRVDIIDKDDHYLFIAELPGVAKEDINIHLQNGLLTIEAKVSEETNAETDQMIRKERSAGFFSRRINVGENIKADEIKAELVNGLLKLTAPKQQAEEKELIHKIEIA